MDEIEKYVFKVMTRLCVALAIVDLIVAMYCILFVR